MNTSDNYQVNKLPQHPLPTIPIHPSIHSQIHPQIPPMHWTSSIVHCDNQPNNQPNKQPNKHTPIKTCKNCTIPRIETFFLQYY